MVDDRPEALRRLEQQLDRASQAAERLADEAGRAERVREDREHRERGRQERKPPPAGWQSPSGQDSRSTLGAELDGLLSAIRSVRELVPPEVLRRLADALKELLLAIRALLDFYIERLERRPPEPPEVQDIPIR